MNTTLKCIAASIAILGGVAYAQTGTVTRDADQQQRIEQGLKSGALTTHEAGKLEHEEAKVNKDQARALSDGKMTDAERAKLTKEQNKVSGDIERQKHDAQKGDPNSPSSRRMQADVQRNVDQQKRIEQGVKSGELTNKETAGLEAREAHTDRGEAKAARDGHVGAKEQRQIQRSENRDSRAIHRQRHDNETR